jgi:two-component system, NarL family, nitrate/nitrite response regulator NarL
VSEPTAAGRTRIVVVEDHPVIRGVIRLACDQAPALEIVAEVETGEAAVEALRREHPDVLLLDLALPGELQGLDVARIAREERLSTRILVVSARADDAAVFESVRAGADGFLSKTEGVRTIADALERVARGETVFSAPQQRAAVSELGRMARRSREGSSVKAVLTGRELDVLDYLALGLTVKQVATRLGLSPRTVDTHIAKLYRKLGVKNRVQAISRAAALGLIDIDG